MSKEKIEEMAKDLQETHDYEGCEAWHCGDCQYEKYGKNHFCSSIKQAEKMTAKGYQKQSEWISIEDRLPEETGKYLVATKNGIVYQTKFYSGGKWGQKDKGRNIAHWMPLPDAPKGGE